MNPRLFSLHRRTYNIRMIGRKQKRLKKKKKQKTQNKREFQRGKIYVRQKKNNGRNNLKRDPYLSYLDINLNEKAKAIQNRQQANRRDGGAVVIGHLSNGEGVARLLCSSQTDT